jgi:hypothetical protein
MTESKEVQLKSHVYLIMQEGSRQLNEYEYGDYDLKGRQVKDIAFNSQFHHTELGTKSTCGNIYIRTKRKISKIILDELPIGKYQLSFNGTMVQTANNGVFNLKRYVSNQLNIFMDIYNSQNVTDDTHINFGSIDCVKIYYSDVQLGSFDEVKYITLITNDGEEIKEMVSPNMTFDLFTNGIVPYLSFGSILYNDGIQNVKRMHVKMDGNLLYSTDIDKDLEKIVCVFKFEDREDNGPIYKDRCVPLKNDGIGFINLGSGNHLSFIFELNTNSTQNIACSILTAESNVIHHSFGTPVLRYQ